MTNTLLIGLALIMGFVFLFNSLAVWAVESSGLKKYRLRNPDVVPLSATNKYPRIVLNGIFAVGLYFGFAYFFSQYVTHDLGTGPLRVVGEVLAILLLYDFMYYLMHRVLHWPRVMKHVHGRHHVVRNPTAADGLYLDPLDNFAGLGLFFLSVVIIGPVSTATFLARIFHQCAFTRM